MNLPNKLTVFRVILVFPFVLILLGQNAGWGWYEVLFGGVMEYMDWVAKHNLITNFGKFMDPLADKLLVSAAMICLIELGRIPAWVVVVIISREFIISGFRLIASDNDIVIAASMWGKYKTVFQMIMVILMLANIPALQLLTNIVMWIATVLTVVSLIDYVYKNRSVLSDFK